MANLPTNAPVSEILKNASTFQDEPRKKSREDWRKAKELEEARKAGTAPAAVDEEGKDINPHIPQYISATPWYFGAQGPTLKHQRPQPEKQKKFSEIDEWYSRGQSNKVATKWRKGACENCGAMGHKRKDCFEKPRKVLAKFTNANIAPDEFVQPNLSLDYDGKRDRWAGYDPSEHRAIIEEYQKIEEAKKQLRAEKLNEKQEEEEDEQEDSNEDEDKYVDEVDMPGTKVDSKQRITVRNLRIREDTAKYLRNLDPNSAYYDPKTRSMRDNPYAGTDKEVDYKGENAARFTGDTQNHAEAQLFAWNVHDKGTTVHLLAEPTKVELFKLSYDKEKEKLKSEARGSVIEKYGGEEHLNAPPPALLLAQTEEYVEYSRTGNIIKGQEKPVIRSRYEEDVYINNHTSVWGSYWHAGQWGFKCCHSFVKNSYCCGESGKRAISEAEEFSSGITVHRSDENITEEFNKNKSEKLETEKISKNKGNSGSSSDSSSESSEEEEEDTRTKTERKSKKEKRKNKKRKQKEKRKNKKKIEKDEDKLKDALRKEEKHQKEAERLLRLDERKRPYNSMFEVKEPTEEEKEAYQMKRMREEDPMAQFMNK